jgi:hypothetical protein
MVARKDAYAQQKPIAVSELPQFLQLQPGEEDVASLLPRITASHRLELLLPLYQVLMVYALLNLVHVFYGCR